MNRRAFLGGSVLGWLNVPRVVVAAQTATPEADTRYINDFADIRGVEEAVTRYAYASSVGFDTAFKGDLYFVDAWGFRFRTESHAGFGPRSMVAAYQDWMTLERGFKFRNLNEAAVRSLGDESSAWVADVVGPDDDNEREYPWSLLAVRKELTVQMLIGTSYAGSPVRRLGDISEETLSRWPNDESRTIYNGEPAGGLWDTLPRLDDLEEGMVIEYSHEASDDFR